MADRLFGPYAIDLHNRALAGCMAGFVVISFFYMAVQKYILAMKLSDQFVDPCSYGQYRLPNIPGTVVSMLTPERPAGVLPRAAFGGLRQEYDKVVLFLADGFGWNFFKDIAHRNPFIQRRIAQGVLHKLVTQFPSTTACNVTSINTGTEVSEHGVYEWFYYEPEADDIIAPLLYSYAREQRIRDSLKRDTRLQAASIYPGESIYRKLSRHGVKSYTFQDREYARSTYSDIIFASAAVTGYDTVRNGMSALARAVIDEPDKAYYYFYFDGIDSALHHYGPGSREVRAAFREYLDNLEKAFWAPLQARGKGKIHDTAFILTADHGQTSIDPSRTIYLNKAFPELEQYLRRNRHGYVMVPAGSCRDMFLYVRDECFDRALELLRNGLRDRAIVCPTADLVKAGYFGACDVSAVLKGRLGNMVVLPLPGESVWWYEQGVFEVDYKGHHGGLTPDEMEIPFLMWSL